MNEVYETLEKYYDFVARKHDIFCVCVTGSQCYNLSDDSSDIDAIAWAVPSFTDLAFGVPFTSIEYTMTNGSHCTVYDIRSLLKTFEDGNYVQYIPFWETTYVPEKYKYDYLRLKDVIQGVEYYNFESMVKKMLGMCMGNITQARKKADKGDFKGAGKNFSYILWNLLMLDNIDEGKTFQDGAYKVNDKDREFVMSYKRKGFVCDSEVKTMLKLFESMVKEIKVSDLKEPSHVSLGRLYDWYLSFMASKVREDIDYV